MVDDLKPDIVVITGDLVDGEKSNFEVALKLIDKLSKKYKVYHVIGNHEEKALLKRYKEKYENYFSQLYSKKIINLDNKCIKLQRVNQV